MKTLKFGGQLLLNTIFCVSALAQTPDFQTIMEGLQTKFDAASHSSWTSEVWPLAVPNPPGSAAWAQIDAAFADHDHTGDGIRDDDQLALLQRILEDEPIALSVLGKARSDEIKAAFETNHALVISREAYYDYQVLNTSLVTMAGPISTSNCPMYMDRTRLRTGQSNTVSICVETGVFIVGDTCLNTTVDLPSVWGDTGLLSENAPGLGDDIADLFAAYLTMGDQANVGYLQAVVYQLVCRGILPRLSGPIAAGLNKGTSEPGESEGTGEMQRSSVDKAYTIPLLSDIDISSVLDPPARTCMDVDCASYVDVSQMDLQIYGDSMQSGIGHEWLNWYGISLNGFGTGYPAVLGVEGDFNNDGISNLDSYNNNGEDRESWFIAEGPTGTSEGESVVEGEPLTEGETPEQTVTVSNVVAQQQGAFLKITYDLATSDGQPTPVDGFFSTNGGAAFPKGMKAVIGDAGKEVVPGTDRWFVWNFEKDGVTGRVEEARVRVHGGPYPGMEREFGGITFCWIPPGSFLMGRYPGEQDSLSNEDPQHEVTFARGFWMSKYEITQGQWQSIMGSNPASGYGVGNNYPVYYVCWDDIRGANGYLNKLNTAHPGNRFRLPSEAEWEYACRAGTTKRFYWGDDPQYTLIGDYAWYSEIGVSDSAKPVGGKLPNSWGLHDMSGNLWEWCEDDSHDNYVGAPTDGSAWVNVPRGSIWLLRGGSWMDSQLGNGWDLSQQHCRSARRGGGTATGISRLFSMCFGFRIVRPMD